MTRTFIFNPHSKKYAMKKILISCVCLWLVTYTNAQDNEAMKKHYLKIYNQAINYNDLNTAINAVHGYLAIENDLVYKDTLSMLYFNAKSYVSSLVLAEEVYKSNPANVDAMARAAECYSEVGDPKSAFALYEQVVPKTKSPYHTYKMAVCQYQLKKTAEAEASARMVMSDTTSGKLGVLFNSLDGSQQAVPLNAAAANLLGVVKMDAGNFTGAKADFQQALTLFPQFVGAKANFDICEKNIQDGKKTPSTSKPPPKPKS